MRITGRGSSYRVIIGFYSLGCFLCVPEMDMGCPLADWSDLFWNQERIAQSLGQADAVTIATALYDFCDPLSHKQDWKEWHGLPCCWEKELPAPFPVSPAGEIGSRELKSPWRFQGEAGIPGGFPTGSMYFNCQPCKFWKSLTKQIVFILKYSRSHTKFPANRPVRRSRIDS